MNIKQYNNLVNATWDMFPLSVGIEYALISMGKSTPIREQKVADAIGLGINEKEVIAWFISVKISDMLSVLGVIPKPLALECCKKFAIPVSMICFKTEWNTGVKPVSISNI